MFVLLKFGLEIFSALGELSDSGIEGRKGEELLPGSVTCLASTGEPEIVIEIGGDTLMGAEAARNSRDGIEGDEDNDSDSLVVDAEAFLDFDLILRGGVELRMKLAMVCDLERVFSLGEDRGGLLETGAVLTLLSSKIGLNLPVDGVCGSIAGVGEDEDEDEDEGEDEREKILGVLLIIGSTPLV